MKLSLNVIRSNPNHIEEVQMEDVSDFVVTDTSILVNFNDGKKEFIPLRANDGENVHEWSGFSLFGTRIGMTVDMKK